MQSIVECVPNFSNGRDDPVIEQIAESIRAVAGVQVLDVSADPDHNRTVITFVGPPPAVEEAAFRSIAVAKKLIDLDKHHGEHPRIGATDVCPFIPIRGVTMQECVDMARRLGQRVGQELGIAVYLYAAAATRPDRENLADIRRGQYEQWKKEVATNPDRKPDYGPSEPRPWGATVIGARPFLIAYNLYLNSSNVAAAETIARSIRFSNGGLRYVQAKGFLVDNQAQVSMNLTNFEATPIYRVQELVRREAERFGLSITKAELVGMIPQKALLDSARWYLQLDDLEEDQVLEFRLQSPDTSKVSLTGKSEITRRLAPTSFIDAVAAPLAVPGGGSVAALAASLAAALAQMAAGLTVGRKRYLDVTEQAQKIMDEAESLRQALTDAIDEDAEAFEQVMAVLRNKEMDELAKADALEMATIHAGEVPLKVARLARDVAYLAKSIASIGNVNAATDAAAGAIMARAAAEAAGLNVRVNGSNLKNSDIADSWREEIESITNEIEQLARAATLIAAERGGF